MNGRGNPHCVGRVCADSDEVARVYRYEVARRFRDDVAHLSDLICGIRRALCPSFISSRAQWWPQASRPTRQLGSREKKSRTFPRASFLRIISPSAVIQWNSHSSSSLGCSFDRAGLSISLCALRPSVCRPRTASGRALLLARSWRCASGATSGGLCRADAGRCLSRLWQALRGQSQGRPDHRGCVLGAWETQVL